MKRAIVMTAILFTLLTAVPQASLARHYGHGGGHSWGHGGGHSRGHGGGHSWGHGGGRGWGHGGGHSWGHGGGHWWYGGVSPWWILPPLVSLATWPLYVDSYVDDYEPPVVVEDAPSRVVIQEPVEVRDLPPSLSAHTRETAEPSPQYWYYCKARKGYYPYVRTCPHAWKRVAAVPPDLSGR
jgi:hypothetical protein